MSVTSLSLPVGQFSCLLVNGSVAGDCIIASLPPYMADLLCATGEELRSHAVVSNKNPDVLG